MTTMSAGVVVDRTVRELMADASRRSCRRYPHRFSLKVQMRPFPVDRLVSMLQSFGVHMTGNAQDLYSDLQIYEQHRGGVFTPGHWQMCLVDADCLGLTNHACIGTLCRVGDNRTDLRLCPVEMIIQLAASRENRPPDGEKWIVCSDPNTHLFTVIPDEGGLMIGTIDPRRTIDSHHRFLFTSHFN